MKRFFYISLALVLVAGFVVTAYAEDRLALSGEYRVRGFYTENTFGYDSDNKLDNKSSFDQRFRLGGKITASEGVTANFRFDFGEETWGNREAGATSPPGAGRPTENNEFQVDRLYLRIERDIANFVAGQYDGAFGYVSGFETQQKWLLLRLKPGPVFVDLAYIKGDEGAGTSDEGDPDFTEDLDLYGANVMYSGEKFSAGAWLGMRTDKTADAVGSAATAEDSDLTGFAVYGSGSFGIVDIKAEFDYFDGESKILNAPAGVDQKGQQLWLFGKVKLGEKMAIPVHFLYAKGYADKANENQVVEMAPAFGDFYPYNLSSIWNGDYSPWGSGEAFDVAGTGGGIMGLYAGFDWQLVEEHKIEFQAGYAAPDTDLTVADGFAGTDTMESYIFGAAGWAWDFVPAAQFAAAFVYGVPSFDDPNQKDDAAYQLLTKIRVKF